MKRSTLKLVSTVAFTLTLCMASTVVFAQGTATGPATSHPVVPGPMVLVGDPNNPQPIDLDPNGPPWSKGIFDPNILLATGGLLDIFETIENVGTEAWGDWHEEILAPPFGLPPAIWNTVVGMEVNGNPITFSVMGLGTQVIWLDNFSQPVLPGDVLTIHKVAEVFPNAAGATGVPLMRLIEYPTPIPEPATCALLVIGSLGLLVRSRPR